MHREQRNVHFGLVRATRQARTGVRTPSSALPVLMPGKGKTPPSKATPDSDSPPDDSEEEEESSSRAAANKHTPKATQSRVPLLPSGAERSDHLEKPSTPRDRFRERGSRDATPRHAKGNGGGGLLSALDAAASTGSSWLNAFENATGLDVDGDGTVGAQTSSRKGKKKKGDRSSSSFSTPMSPVAAAGLRSPASLARAELARPRMYTVRDVSADMPLSELTWRLLDEPWYDEEFFGSRAGFVALSGDLDIDSPQELVRISNALAGVARAIEQADAASTDGSGRCFVVCDLFSRLSEERLQELSASDQAVSNLLTQVSASQPIAFLQRALCRHASLALVMSLPTIMMQRIGILRRLLPARVLVVIETSSTQLDSSPREPLPALKLLAAFTRCSEPSGAERPRRRAVALALSDQPLPLLSQLGFCAQHDIRVVLFEVQSPAAQLIRLLHELWPRRTLGSFDPIAAQDHLSQILDGSPSDPGSVDDLRAVLTRGRLVVHPAQSSAENLENVCVQELMGDHSLRLASEQRVRYLTSMRLYSWPSKSLSALSIVLAIVAAAVAVAADELYDDYSDYDDVQDVLQVGVFSRVFLNGLHEQWATKAGYICAALPALLAVIQLVQSLMTTSEAALAVERAAGLVERAVYLYRCRAGSYADLPLSTAEAGTTSDVSTLRRRMLTRDLAAVATAVDDSGAMLIPSLSSPSSERHDGSPFPMWLRKAWCMCCCRPGTGDPPETNDDRMDGDAYARERLLPALQQSTSNARWLLVLSLGVRSVSLLALAVGTALALLGLLHWVAVAVALSTAASRFLELARVEERRRAHVRAAASLNAAKVRWESLPAEAHTWQSEVDALVLRSEQAVESTLPVVAGFGQGSGGLILTSLVFEVYTE